MLSSKRRKPGEIVLFIGPMFAEKSTELIRHLRRYKRAGKKNFWLSMKSRKNLEDSKYTHDGWKIPFDDICSEHRFLDVDADDYDFTYEIDEPFSSNPAFRLSDFDVVGIDEAQFFRPRLAEFCETLASRGTTVLVAGLSGTSSKKEWPTMSALIPKADDVVHLKAVCKFCGKKAPFTAKIDDDDDDDDGDGDASASEKKDGKESERREGDPVDLGADDKYRAVCRKCYRSTI
jgi:thymidine kinase